MTETHQSAKKRRLLAVNDRGHVIGEQHHRAKLTDHDVDLVLDLLEARDALIAKLRRAGASCRQVQLALIVTQLSAEHIAGKFEVSRRTIRDIGLGRIRGQLAVAWRKADTGRQRS